MKRNHLSWMARVAGLPCLQARLQLSIVRAFATATAPTERRESLPLPLSFVIWLERRVADPSAPPSEALFLGFLLIAVWASLRWGDRLWIPPDRLHLQLTHLAVLGTALCTKTTARSMPFGFLITGVSGSPSCNWGMRFLNLLRQALSDTQSRQPGRVVDFLPACLGGSDPRPFILEPCPRRLAVPRLLSLLHQHWRPKKAQLRRRRNFLCMVRTAARPLCWPGPGKCLWIVHFVGSKATAACPVQITPSSFMDVTTSVRCLTCRHRLLITSVQASVHCSHLLEAHPCHSRTSPCVRLCPLWALILRNHCSPLRLFRRTRHQCLHHLRLLLPWTFRLSRLSRPQWTVHLTLPWIRLHLLQIPMQKWRVALRLGPLLPCPCRRLPLSALPSGLACLRSPAFRSSFLITAPMWCMPSVPRLTRTRWLSPTRRIRKPSSARPSARQSAARFRLQPRHVCIVLATGRWHLASMGFAL